MGGEMMSKKALSLTLDAEIVKKIEKLSQETERPKSYFVNLALKEFLEELEDLEIALRRKKEKRITLDQLKKKLGIE
jgi:predicted DNA-binding protein